MFEVGGGLKVVLGWWARGCPWLGGGSGGLSLVKFGSFFFYVAVFRVSGAPPPLEVGAFYFMVNIFGVGFLPFISKKY